jgi:lipopolysaccharide export system protein LptC
VWTARQNALALAFALMGGAAWWLMERQPEQDRPAVPGTRVPDYVVSELNAVETDETGQPSRVLSARQLRQYVEEDLAELDLPRLTLYQSDGPPWRAEARSGLLLAGGDELRLWDDVRVERAAGAGNRPVHLATSELSVWPKREYAQGDRPVRIDSAGDWLTATGLRLWYATPARAEFPGRAHLFIVPEGTEKPPAQEGTR